MELLISQHTIVETKLDRVSGDISDVKLVQAEQAKDLKHHISRTDLLQDMVMPLHTLKLQIWGIIKFLTIASSIGGLGWLLKILLKLF